jgi:hypothetical protein
MILGILTLSNPLPKTVVTGICKKEYKMMIKKAGKGSGEKLKKRDGELERM